MNDAFASLLGYPAEKLIGEELRDLTARARDPEQCVSWEGHDTRELRLVTADGGERVVVTYPSPVGSDGSIVLLCCDITTRCVATQDALERERAARGEVARYAEMLQAASDWYWETDAELRYTYFSPNAGTLSGITSSDILGKRRDEYGDAHVDSEQWPDHVAMLRARKPFRDFVYRFRRSDGTVLWIKTSGVPIFGADQQFLGYRGIASNVTAQVEAERAVRQSEHRLHQLFEVASDWFWETDVDGHFTFLSPRWRAVTGQNPAQYIGRRRDEFGDQSTNPRAWRRHLETLRARKPFRDFTYRLVSRNGEARWVKTSGIPIFDEETGEFRGYRGVGTDIHQMKVQEEALRHREAEARAARERAERADRAKSSFLAAMSHELRTPLNAIIGFAEMIELVQLGPIPEHYRQYGAIICKGGRHLLAIINDILDFAKVEAGKIELFPEQIEVSAIITDVLRLVAGDSQAKKMRLMYEVNQNLEPIEADPIRLRQVLFNLISNAIKFTPESGTVTISAHECKEGVRIEVADTGVGMAEADIPKAFEPFAQIANGLRKREGTGLGLPLARSLVELHGGRLEITSAPNVGTRVSTLFPRFMNSPSQALAVQAG